MGWEEDHQKRVALFPPEIREAHKHCTKHRSEINASKSCGCFYCMAIFESREIREWTDQDEADVGQTALCPKCGIDSVIGDKAGFSMSEDFLKQMHHYWFDT
jgi:hypothetical protein